MIDYVIVLNKDDNTVSFIDEPNQKVVKVVPVEKNPHEVAVTANGRKAFISKWNKKRGWRIILWVAAQKGLTLAQTVRGFMWRIRMTIWCGHPS
ncbi:hypothetical protein MNBD_CHLOROFLEXI01-3778 [hydrothermal vent metagenome]|uniref:Uncharacterized protein n=1 Tax=hydrothermal vent metagenome TaxID=652676 RepID=A0A3B0VNL4_9ZZZZ